jgi:predicted patatin/cPLA2 family phospholipase
MLPAKPITLLCLPVMLVCFAGCCTSRNCERAGQNVAKYQFQPSSIRTALGNQSESKAGPVDILVLSGGGSHGAWGAGVLRGWRENQESPRPGKFQVVTGVSTGALLATHAFLGAPEDDDLLQEAYTKVKTSDIYHNRFLPFALFSDSLKSSSPLKHTVARYITEQTLEQVARAGRQEHRRLYAGSVNYDTGKLVIWDLTAIAMDETNPQRLELYRRVVLASASIPILVPPVNIDGNLYTDGGARAQLFFEKGFLSGLGQISHTNLTLYVIVNGKLGMDTNCVNDCLKDLTLRTLDMLLDANAIGNLYHIKSELDRIGFGKFRLSRIPPELPVTSSAEFVPRSMQALYDAGYQFGKSGKWERQVPEVDLRSRL